MLERTLTTDAAWKTQNLEELEIKINSLPDFYRYEPLQLKNWWYIEIHHLTKANSYLGYVMHDHVGARLMERFSL